MNLETFKNRFLSHCKKENIVPHDFVLESIRNAYQPSDSQNYVLIFSGKNFQNDICKMLSDCFRHDTTFEEILFDDCMPSADCLQLILEGLCDNSTCTRLSLKGNNIKNQGCELLARLIRQNSSISKLSLEWNQIGVSTNGFQQLCDSLAASRSLRSLDLRNNQIGFDNCQILVAAMQKNDYICELDLRYNSLGVAGGKELLQLFQKNRTLRRLLVLGNNIPLDMMTDIENCAHRNGEIHMHNGKSPSKSDRTTKSLSNHENHRKQHTSDLLDRIDRQDNGFRMSDKKSFSKIIQLEKLLDERQQKCRQLKANLDLVESKLEMHESQFKEQEIHFQKSLKEREYLERQYNLQLDKEKEFRVDMEKRFLMEQSQLHERILQLQNRISELEINVKQQNQKVSELKEQKKSFNSEQKSKELEYGGIISKLKEQHQKDINDINEKKDRELRKLRQDSITNEEMWRDKISKYEDSREELNQEVLRLRNQIASDKMLNDENIHQIKQRIRNEEEQKINKLDEELRTVQTIKDELESQNARQAREIEGLQKDNSKLKIETESLKIKKDNLQEELSGKQSEMMSEIEKVRMEWMHRVQKLENERQSQTDLFNKIEQQDKQIQDMRNSFREELHSRNTEIQALRDKAKSQEMEINRRNEDEKIRTCALQNAILQYCQPSVSNSFVTGNRGD